MDHGPMLLDGAGCALALTPYFFMDIKSAKNQKVQPQQTDLDTQLRKAAKLYERQFLNEMMRAMRNTVDHGGITKPSMAEKIYQDELYGEYAEKWVENGGNGLADGSTANSKKRSFSQYSRYVQQQTPPPKRTREEKRHTDVWSGTAKDSRPVQ